MVLKKHVSQSEGNFLIFPSFTEMGLNITYLSKSTPPEITIYTYIVLMHAGKVSRKNMKSQDYF